MGKNVINFEKEFTKYIGCKFSNVTASCTGALELTLKALNISYNDEVIVPCQTFFATASAVIRNNAIPVFCNVDKNFSIDFQNLKSLVTRKTKAIIVVHFAGLIQDKTKKWLKAQGINDYDWPLMKYGSRKDGQDRVTEDVMVNIYASHWGILMPGYFHAGSGWWRARPLQVADAGSILIGDPTEMMIYYGDERLASIKASDLIDMCDQELIDLATAQREALYKLHPLDKEVEKMELNACLKS